MILTRAGRVALAAWGLGLLLCLAVILRTPFVADLSAFLPASPDAQQRVLVDQLQTGAASRLLMIGIEGGDAARRAEASRRLAATLRASDRFEQVSNGERGSWEAVGAWLLAHRYQLSPAVTPERFTEAGLRDAIDETLSLLGTPAGAAIKPLLERDPTGEVQRIVEGLVPANAPRSADGVWVSRTAPRVLLLASTRVAGGDIDGQQAAVEQIRSAFEALQFTDLSLQVSGPGVFAVASRSAIETEVRGLSIEAAVMMTVLLLLAFGSLRAVGVAALPVATGLAAGVAAVGLVFGKVHGLTLGFGGTLIGEAVDYAIYFLVQARSAGAPAGEGWRHWLERQWPTVRLGLATSVCGFGMLAFSGFPGLAQLGVFSFVGLCAAAAAARFVLPVLMPDGASGTGVRRPLAGALRRALVFLPRLRLAGLALTVAALALLLWQRDQLWRGDLLSLSPVPRPLIELDAQLRADLGTSDARTLVLVQSPRLEDALSGAEAAAARLDGLVEAGVIAGYDTPTRLLPSRAAQAARLASLPDEASLRQALAAATAGGPLPAARLEPFVADVAAARRGSPIDRETLEADPAVGAVLGPLLEAQILRSGDGWSVLIALQPARDVVVTVPVQQALQGLPGVGVVDIAQSMVALYDSYLREAMGQALAGGAAVALLLAAWLRSARRLLAVALPLAGAVLLPLAGLALAGVGLGILHLVGMLLVVAVGSNYALFFDQLAQAGQADEDTLASLLFANLTTVGAFGLLALSEIPALYAIGQVVAPGALLALVLSAMFARLPAASR